MTEIMVKKVSKTENAAQNLLERYDEAGIPKYFLRQVCLPANWNCDLAFRDPTYFKKMLEELNRRIGTPMEKLRDPKMPLRKC